MNRQAAVGGKQAVVRCLATRAVESQEYQASPLTNWMKSTHAATQPASGSWLVCENVAPDERPSSGWVPVPLVAPPVPATKRRVKECTAWGLWFMSVNSSIGHAPTRSPAHRTHQYRLATLTTSGQSDGCSTRTTPPIRRRVENEIDGQAQPWPL